MALTNLNGHFIWPTPLFLTGALQIINYNLYGGTIKLAYIFKAPKAGTIDMIEWDMPSPFTSQPMRVAFQGLTGNNPNGTTTHFRNFTPNAGWKTPGLITTDGTDSGTKKTVTKNEWIAAVMEWTGTAGDVYFRYLNSAYVGGDAHHGVLQSDFYWMTYTGTTWSGHNRAHGVIFTVKYDDGTYGRMISPAVPILSIATETFASNSTPDERGLHFNLTAPMRINGGWIVLDKDAAADLVLYDTDGTTVLGSVSIGTQRGEDTLLPECTRFTTDIDLPVGNGYRLVVKPTTTTAVGIQVYTLNTAAHREAHSGGLTCQYTARTDAGAWTQTDTKIPVIGLIVSGLDSGGSMVVTSGESIQFSVVRPD